jgi:hypothetical protein
MPTAQAGVACARSPPACAAPSVPPLRPKAPEHIVVHNPPSAPAGIHAAHFYSERFTARSARLLRRILRTEWRHLAYRLRAPAWPLSDPTDFAIWPDRDRAVYAMFAFANEAPACCTLHCVATVDVDPATQFVRRLVFHAPFGPLGCAYEAIVGASPTVARAVMATRSCEPATSPPPRTGDADFLWSLPWYCPVLVSHSAPSFS